MHIFAPASYSVACHYYRMIAPFRYLQTDYPQHKLEIGLTDPSGEYDVLMVYGSQPITNAPEIANQKRRGAKVVYNLDDTYWSWPQWRCDLPSKDVVGMVNLMTELADHIVVSTPTLMEDVGKQWKTTVAPNLMEVGAYGCPTVPKDDGRLTISWIGAAAHKGDLQLIDRACNRIAKDYKDRVKFHFVGAGPDDTLRDNWGSNCHLTEWFPLVHYWDVLRQIRPHIVLAPLADCRFNWCKSNIRCLEAHCLNSALIYTPLAEYGAANVPNVTGLPATTEDEWYDAMALLIEDSTLREEVATNGHRQVCDEWNWESPNARQKWGYTMDAIERTNWK